MARWGAALAADPCVRRTGQHSDGTSMTGRKRLAALSPREPLAALLGLAPRLPGPWYTSASNIAMQPVTVRAAATAWSVHVHAYAVRNHLTDPRQVEITVGLAVSAKRLPRSHAGRARVAEWQQGLATRLATIGYEGVWGRSPEGPFAHFTRQLRSVSAIPAAIRALQRVQF
jgi:hypothetical protein